MLKEDSIKVKSLHFNLKEVSIKPKEFLGRFSRIKAKKGNFWA